MLFFCGGVADELTEETVLLLRETAVFTAIRSLLDTMCRVFLYDPMLDRVGKNAAQQTNCSTAGTQAVDLR
jgi:hypothetical protein